MKSKPYLEAADVKAIAAAADLNVRICQRYAGSPRRATGKRRTRVAAAFDWQGVLTPAGVRVDAWVAPPLYTNKPPIILTAAKDGVAGTAISRSTT